MNIDFTNDIIQMKERNVLHKPFPTPQGYALFEKTEKGKIIRMVFSSEEGIKAYLNDIGYDWGNEGKGEFTNFDCLNRILTVFPELKDAEIVAADPQWDPDAKPQTEHEKQNLHESTRKIEDLPDLAVELREVDHVQAKKPDFLKKKSDKKDDKKDDKKNGKKGDEEEKDKNGKKLPPWLNKKKSKSKDYSDLYEKVGGNKSQPWLYGFEAGDKVRNVNEQCKHYRSEGTVKEVKDLPEDAGFLVGYTCSNAGNNWGEGDLLFKTPDQLEKLDQTGAPCGPDGNCVY